MLYFYPIVTGCTSSSSVTTRCHLLSPVVARYYMFSPVITYYHSLSPVIPRRQPFSPVITHYHSVSPVITRRHPLSPVITRYNPIRPCCQLLPFLSYYPKWITCRIYGRTTGSASNVHQYFKTTIYTYPEKNHANRFNIKEVYPAGYPSGYFPNRITCCVSGRTTGSASNVHQYFKTTIDTYSKNFMQIS